MCSQQEDHRGRDVSADTSTPKWSSFGAQSPQKRKYGASSELSRLSTSQKKLFFCRSRDQILQKVQHQYAGRHSTRGYLQQDKRKGHEGLGEWTQEQGLARENIRKNKRAQPSSAIILHQKQDRYAIWLSREAINLRAEPLQHLQNAQSEDDRPPRPRPQPLRWKDAPDQEASLPDQNEPLINMIYFYFKPSTPLPIHPSLFCNKQYWILFNYNILLITTNQDE